jgi:hypothetical protein
MTIDSDRLRLIDRAFGHRGDDQFPGADADSTAFWKPGELIRDTVEFVIPETARFDALELSLGFYRGNVRMAAEDAAGGPIARRAAAGPRIQVVRSSR